MIGVDLDDEALARAAWSRLTEPADPVAGWLVRVLGAGRALRLLLSSAGDADGFVTAVAERCVATVAERSPGSAVARGGAAGTGRPAGPDAAAVPAGAELRMLAVAMSRWWPRVEHLDPRRELTVLRRMGGELLVPGDPRWPARLDDLGDLAPMCLWVRGDADLASQLLGSVAVVGARAATGYGEHVASGLSAGLAGHGLTVVSGGAYGIDATAHRSALAGGGRTVVFLAGGVDRLYPAGNTELLRAAARSGAVVGEVPPGSVPSRTRFLLRNRLIAAVTAGTVVVEAAWRSGALNTARHAAELLRPVGAVPGPVTSMASAGCHRLLREGAAVCVTDVEEVMELVGPLGVATVDAADGAAGLAEEPMDPAARRLADAVPLRGGATAESLARATGLSVAEVLGLLGRWELTDRVHSRGGRWWRGGSR